MKLVAIALSAVLVFTAAGFSQSQSNTQGAKRLFDDTSTGVRLGGSEPRPVPRPSSSTTPAPQPAAPGPKAPDVTGLMYYIELVQPSGQALRVNTNQVFHSGQRIRFHVLSNLAGRLTILQSENNAAFLPLFPNPQLRGGDNRVELGKETIVPMAFDNNPGDLRLLLMLVADSPPSGAQTASTQRPAGTPAQTPAPAPAAQKNPAPPPGPASTQPLQTTPQASPVQRASTDNLPPLAGRQLPPITEDDIRAMLRQQATSKALKIEVDDTPSNAAVYTVNDTRQDPNMTPGTVAVEVRINHQP